MDCYVARLSLPLVFALPLCVNPRSASKSVHVDTLEVSSTSTLDRLIILEKILATERHNLAARIGELHQLFLLNFRWVDYW